MKIREQTVSVAINIRRDSLDNFSFHSWQSDKRPHFQIFILLTADFYHPRSYEILLPITALFQVQGVRIAIIGMSGRCPCVFKVFCDLPHDSQYCQSYSKRAFKPNHFSLHNPA